MTPAEIALKLACTDIERMSASACGRPMDMSHVEKSIQNYNREARRSRTSKAAVEKARAAKGSESP